MKPLPNLRNLRILSLSRNNIKKIAGLEEVGDCLEELWLSYNKIQLLSNLHCCRKLKVLYISNNKISKWDEIDKLKDLSKLSTVLFKNNPIYWPNNIKKCLNQNHACSNLGLNLVRHNQQ